MGAGKRGKWGGWKEKRVSGRLEKEGGWKEREVGRLFLAPWRRGSLEKGGRAGVHPVH